MIVFAQKVCLQEAKDGKEAIVVWQVAVRPHDDDATSQQCFDEVSIEGPCRVVARRGGSPHIVLVPESGTIVRGKAGDGETVFGGQ